MTATGTVHTGRTRERTYRLCQCCQARITYGEPEPSAAWVQRLRLTPEQHDLLLVAAADFKKLCDELEEPADPVGFADWIRVDVLGRHTATLVQFDGRTRVEPQQGRERAYRHSEAFPLPGRRAR